MKKLLTLSLGVLATAAFQILPASAQSPAASQIAAGRAALAQQTPEALENAHQAFKAGLQSESNNAALNFFYAATLLTREAHTAEFKQQFTSLNATITNPSSMRWNTRSRLASPAPCCLPLESRPTPTSPT
ncbi:MAG: hypothetical protein NTZ94_01815 [Verrucomicrobia bacterium]|nr:hypothetical protein [Verrucomicrobiota bacterium]